MHEVRTYFVLSERSYLLIYNTLSHLSFIHLSLLYTHTYRLDTISIFHMLEREAIATEIDLDIWESVTAKT